MLKHAMIRVLKEYGMAKRSVPFTVGKVRTIEDKLLITEDDIEFDALSAELRHWRKVRRDSEDLIVDMDFCLAQLSEKERQVLRAFYTDREPYYAEGLMLEWDCERSTVYRIKDKRLEKLRFYWYGYEKSENYRKYP